MKWIIGALLICVIIQEIQIIVLRRDLDEISELFILAVADKIKDIKAYIIDPNSDADDDDNTGA